MGQVPRLLNTGSSLLLVAALLAGAGCTAGRAARSGQTVRELHLDPVHVVSGGPEALALADLNDEELFQVASAAFAAADYEGSARAFSRLAAVFPESRHAGAARFNAGLSWERMTEYLRALSFYAPLLESQSGREWRDVAFRTAEALYHLEDFATAADLLGRLADAPGISPAERIEALVKRGVCLIEAGDESEAEQSLRTALGRYHLERRESEEVIDAYFAAQGQHFLGEVFRLRFERARLDPEEADLEVLRDDMEHKAALLLSAQGHYLRAIRLGESKWATASAYRIGRLYEDLYEQLMSARMPGELGDTASRLAYRELLAERVRTLLTKAMDAYERTLTAAERMGVDGPWRERVQASFERVKALLLQTPPPVRRDS